MLSIDIGQWHKLCSAFEDFFTNVNGEVEYTEDVLRFISPHDQVQTSLFLYRRGDFAASMPLHGIDAKVEDVRFKPGDYEIQLIGDGVDYTYKVPPQLVMGE
tara:strand:- start:1140 stop:1445 length:306 start_codon:yes stop_codon:yes gene_type:complete